VIAEWRKFVICTPNQILAGSNHDTHGSVCIKSVGKPEGKIPLWRPRYRHDNDDDLKNLTWMVNCIHMAQDMAQMVTNLQLQKLH
jgi:hypothetical protein